MSYRPDGRNGRALRDCSREDVMSVRRQPPTGWCTADTTHAGDLLRALTVGTDALCSTPPGGTSLAVVQGSKVTTTPSTSSGCSELPGDDSVITLGSFAVDLSGRNVGTDQQAGTTMHEL